MAVLTDVSLRQCLNRDFVIYPHLEELITPLGYDLRIGFAVSLNDRGDVIEPISEDGIEYIPIQPQGFAFIVSKESVWLSGRIVGTLHSRGSFAAKGLYVNATTIDPNWRGQMTFLVHNTGYQEIPLNIDEPFITMILHRAEDQTTNTPQTNPITVAQNYGEFYGAPFYKSINNYLTSDNLNRQGVEFTRIVEQATKFTIGRIARELIRSIGFAIIKPFKSWLNFSLLLSILSIPAFTVGIARYWHLIRPYFNNIEYDSKIFAGSFAGIFSIVAIMISIINNMKKDE